MNLNLELFAILLNRNFLCWTCTKMELELSISSRQLQNESRVSWKLCLTLCSLRLLKFILGLAKNFNSSGLWMSNIALGDGLIFLRMRWSCECWYQVPISYYIRKKGNLKSQCPSLQLVISQSGTCHGIACRLIYKRVDIWRWSINH